MCEDSEKIKVLPPFSLIRDFSNQNACGNVSKISVNHTDDIPYSWFATTLPGGHVGGQYRRNFWTKFASK